MRNIQSATGDELKNARKASAWTQAQAAARLGVTQAYLSMVERGERAVSSELAAKAVEVLEVPATALPLTEYETCAHDAGFFQSMLGSLGYSGFAYLRSSVRLNPVEVLMEALDSDDLDSRVTEALAWLPLAYPHLNWEWLTANAKLRDRQNRLGFVVELARILRIRKSEIHAWIKKEWLQATTHLTGKRLTHIITPEAFRALYTHHLRDLLEQKRVPNIALFEAFYNYCFVPKHTIGTQLLTVRRDKREREAFATAIDGPDLDEMDDEDVED